MSYVSGGGFEAVCSGSGLSKVNICQEHADLRGLLLLLMLQEKKKKDFLCANGFLIRDSSLTLDPLKEKKNNYLRRASFRRVCIILDFICATLVRWDLLAFVHRSVFRSCVLSLLMGRNLLHTGLRWMIFSKNSTLVQGNF